MNVTIILPTYNEKENIEKVLLRLRQAFGKSKHKVNYLVVDDNSPDGTKDVVTNLAKEYKDIFLITGQKEGLGKALLRGMRKAVKDLNTDFILQMDADLSHDPSDAPKLIDKLDQGYDFSIGARYIPGGSIPENWGIHRKIFSKVGNMIVRYGLGYPNIHDWTGGFRAYNKQYFEKSEKTVEKFKGYVFQIAFLHNAIKIGANIAEVLIHFTDRMFGRSKIAPTEYIKNVLEYVFSARWQRLKEGTFGKFAVVGTVGFIINTLILEIGVKAGLHPGISSALGAECAIISNFTLNNSWTFSARKIKGKGKLLLKFLQFNTTSVGAIIIQSGTVTIGSILFGTNYYRIYYVFGVGIGLIWNYIMYSRVIWCRK